jgi:carbonic anhydrase
VSETFIMIFLPRALPAALLGLGVLACALPAQASEPVIKTSPGKSALGRQSDPDAEADLGKLSRKGGKAQTAEERDDETIDQLRERLARKLGAQRATEKPADPNVLKVVSRPAAPSPVVIEPAPAPAATAVSPGAAPAPGIHWSEPRRPAAAVPVRGHAAAAPAAKAASAAAAPKKVPHGDHWSYQGESGPENWGLMKAEYSLCSSGKRQSPIDIRDGIAVQLDPVQFDYKPSNFRVIDNGHTVQVNVAPGNSIEVTGKRFELVQFHFHRPSEERINGRQFDMVAHLVHKDLEGKLAVVAVLLDRGSAHPIVQTVWNNLPLEKGEEQAAKATLDLNALLPADRGYFTYMGSLTTPPCSEGVLWMVMKNPVSISSEQIGIFSRLYPMNARPVQSASGRLIKGSN